MSASSGFEIMYHDCADVLFVALLAGSKDDCNVIGAPINVLKVVPKVGVSVTGPFASACAGANVNSDETRATNAPTA